MSKWSCLRMPFSLLNPLRRGDVSMAVCLELNNVQCVGEGVWAWDKPAALGWFGCLDVAVFAAFTGQIWSERWTSMNLGARRQRTQLEKLGFRAFAKGGAHA